MKAEFLQAVKHHTLSGDAGFRVTGTLEKKKIYTVLYVNRANVIQASMTFAKRLVCTSCGKYRLQHGSNKLCTFYI